MDMHWTFGRRLAASFGLAGITLVVIVFLAFQTTSGLINTNRAVAHTLDVRLAFANLLSYAKDLETGQRGYTITGVDDFLEPYNAAITELPATIATLRKLTADNPSQQKRLDQAEALIATKMKLSATNIEVRRTQGLAAGAALISQGEGKKVMDGLRVVLTEADAEEARLLADRDAASEASAGLATAIILWGGIIAAALVAIIGWFITRALIRQIGSAVGHMESSSAELQAAANQQATGVREQATSMSEITTTISELLATSRQIAESAQRVAQISEQTSSSARNGNDAVERANESVGGIRRQVDQIVTHMLDLGKRSQQIGAVLDIVSELAEQTNILSINATIEAAGAGENGRRFSVVADEIRKLADRVGGSAKEVRALIEDVRGSVNTTVMATETGSKAVDAGSRQFNEVASQFKDIARLVTVTAEAAREIELSTKQQATAVEQVNIAIANVSQATRETESSAAQTLQTASELASTSRDLLKLVRPTQVSRA